MEQFTLTVTVVVSASSREAAKRFLSEELETLRKYGTGVDEHEEPVEVKSFQVD